MYEESVCFDSHRGLVQTENDFSKTHLQNCNFSINEQSFSENHEMEIQQQLNLEMEQSYNNTNINELQNGVQNHFIQEIVNDSNWNGMCNSSFDTDHNQIQTPYPNTPDLLNMFPLPRCSVSSLLPNSSITLSNKSSSTFLGSVVYNDPLLQLDLPPQPQPQPQPQPPFLKELLHSLPHGCGGTYVQNGSLFDERDLNCGFYQDGGDNKSFDNGVFEFSAGELNSVGKSNKDGKKTKHQSTEKGRRVLLNDKFQALRNLVPNPTKNDRASIVGDAIDYIHELKRTVSELKVLVEKKRCARERLKRPKTEADEAVFEGNNDSKSLNGSALRSSWLHRKSKNSEVDVRIIDDEVTVKLVQQKRINCLLTVSRVLDELQLDLHHVAGGLIGDYYSFLFNSKICEGSIVYASAIANKVIEVVDKEYAAILPTNSY
ncbi:hypothetical protein RD792_015641 [Penstemon davidsonii]|uniref:BHLH domain-containing protein n=1 Tax=Penstemon davidsonii TaxID=160366 RepID=A0ABR0CH99_9LAMI|nr:hypothetical protein RD792_015641 [Penstemon davidsonii]